MFSTTEEAEGAGLPSATTTSASATSTHSSVVDSETGESSSFPWSFLSSGSSGAWDDGAGVGVGGAVFLTMMLVLLGSYATAAARMGSRTTVRSMIDGEWVFVSACGACLLCLPACLSLRLHSNEGH